MKLKLSIILLMAMQYSKASVHNVSNLPGTGIAFNNVNSAIAAASPGDTVYVHGSTTIYPDFTIDKSIVILGTGGFPQTEFGLKSRFNRVTISSNTSNIKILGISIVDYHLDFYNVSNVHHVLIANNFFEASSYGNLRFENMSNSSDIRVFNNVFAGGGTNKVLFGNNSNCSNIMVDHNIINGCIQSLNILNAVVQNNIFYNPSGANAFFGSNSLMIVSNNIFFGADPIFNNTTSVYNNNISYSSSTVLTAMGGTNLDNMNPQLVNVPTTGNYSIAHNFNLQAGSPCIAAGADGLDIGYYGGTETLSPLGEPLNMPVIRLMNIQNTLVPQNGNVNVKVRSTKSRGN
jgi:hypothetical protein